MEASGGVFVDDEEVSGDGGDRSHRLGGSVGGAFCAVSAEAVGGRVVWIASHVERLLLAAEASKGRGRSWRSASLRTVPLDPRPSTLLRCTTIQSLRPPPGPPYKLRTPSGPPTARPLATAARVDHPLRDPIDRPESDSFVPLSSLQSCLLARLALPQYRSASFRSL